MATGGSIEPVVQVFPSNSTAKLLTMVVPSTGSAATAFWLKLKVQDIVSIPFNNEIVVCLFVHLFVSDISKFFAGNQFDVFEDLFST